MDNNTDIPCPEGFYEETWKGVTEWIHKETGEVIPRDLKRAAEVHEYYLKWIEPRYARESDPEKE